MNRSVVTLVLAVFCFVGGGAEVARSGTGQSGTGQSGTGQSSTGQSATGQASRPNIVLIDVDNLGKATWGVMEISGYKRRLYEAWQADMAKDASEPVTYRPAAKR